MKVLPLVVGVGLLAVLEGCPSPNVYGTARTLPKGESQHTFAFERFSVVGTDANASATSLPTYQYRHGSAIALTSGFGSRT